MRSNRDSLIHSFCLENQVWWRKKNMTRMMKPRSVTWSYRSVELLRFSTSFSIQSGVSSTFQRTSCTKWMACSTNRIKSIRTAFQRWCTTRSSTTWASLSKLCISSILLFRRTPTSWLSGKNTTKCWWWHRRIPQSTTLISKVWKRLWSSALKSTRTFWVVAFSTTTLMACKRPSSRRLEAT